MQHQRLLKGELEIQLWPWMKFLLLTHFRPAMCSTKCLSNQKDMDCSSEVDESSKGRADRFVPTTCSTEVSNESYISKHEELEVVIYGPDEGDYLATEEIEEYDDIEDDDALYEGLAFLFTSEIENGEQLKQKAIENPMPITCLIEYSREIKEAIVSDFVSMNCSVKCPSKLEIIEQEGMVVAHNHVAVTSLFKNVVGANDVEKLKGIVVVQNSIDKTNLGETLRIKAGSFASAVNTTGDMVVFLFDPGGVFGTGNMFVRVPRNSETGLDYWSTSKLFGKFINGSWAGSVFDVSRTNGVNLLMSFDPGDNWMMQWNMKQRKLLASPTLNIWLMEFAYETFTMEHHPLLLLYLPKAFHEMVKAGVGPNIHIYNSIIDGCARADQVAKAFGVYGIMSSKNVKPDRVVFNALLSAGGESGSIDHAFDELEETKAETEPIDPDHVTIGALMKVSAKSGQADRALEVSKMIDEKNMKGTPEVYAIVVDSCSQNADMLDAFFEIIKTARAKGIQAGVVAYASLMGACTNAKDWQKALQLYEHIKEINLKPTISMMNVLVAALCDAKELHKAIEILFEIKRQGLLANTITYLVLLVVANMDFELLGVQSEENRVISLIKFDIFRTGLNHKGGSWVMSDVANGGKNVEWGVTHLSLMTGTVDVDLGVRFVDFWSSWTCESSYRVTLGAILFHSTQASSKNHGSYLCNVNLWSSYMGYWKASSAELGKIDHVVGTSNEVSIICCISRALHLGPETLVQTGSNGPKMNKAFLGGLIHIKGALLYYRGSTCTTSWSLENRFWQGLSKLDNHFKTIELATLFNGLFVPRCNLQMDSGINLTHGQVIQRAGWNDANLFYLTHGRDIQRAGWNDSYLFYGDRKIIKVKLSVNTFTLGLRLFFKLVNGLDPPLSSYGFARGRAFFV